MYAGSIIKIFVYKLKIKVMKTYPNFLNPVKQYVLIVSVALFGFTIKANAQSALLGKEVEKINNSVVVQLAEYDFDIIIPKVSKDELIKLKDATFNQIVYVADGAKGYYFYMGATWEKQNVREVFELIDMNLAIQNPNPASLILVAEEGNSSALLDYNHHVKSIYQDFGFDSKKDN